MVTRKDDSFADGALEGELFDTVGMCVCVCVCVPWVNVPSLSRCLLALLVQANLMMVKREDLRYSGERRILYADGSHLQLEL
jgi:hypothetical protein